MALLFTVHHCRENDPILTASSVYGNPENG
jgi:hypothetical protein